MNKAFIDILQFAHEHSGDDPLQLLMQRKRYPGINLPLVAQQLEAQQQASAKWPTLADCANYFYPPRLNREQSSSEAAAMFKAGLVRSFGGGTLIDLTGGMGADTYFMSREAEHTDYCEQDADLCAIAQHNFDALGTENISCHSGDSIEFLADSKNIYDTIYIDPARRDEHGRKVAAFEDCTPNLLQNLNLLRSRCKRLLIKASPMIDISQAEQQLGAVSDIYIVAVKGECKEVLFQVPNPEFQVSTEAATLHCLDIRSIFPTPSIFSFTRDNEESASCTYASEMATYLYEPHAALMKGGCFRMLSQNYGIAQLARNTHLYTSEQLIDNFPGRVFRVVQPATLTAKAMRSLLPEGKAHVITRNYPLSAESLQQKLKLREGGTCFIIAATLGSRPMGWLCEQNFSTENCRK